MLLGLIAPSAGQIHLLGRRLPDPRAVAQTGSMIEEPAFYPWMTGAGQPRGARRHWGGCAQGEVARVLSLVGTASFVQAWMNFDTAGYLPTNFWSRFVSGGPQLSELAGLSGIVVTGAVAAVIARWRFAADVSV